MTDGEAQSTSGQFVPDAAAEHQGGRTGRVLRSILVRCALRRVLHQHTQNDNDSLFKFRVKQLVKLLNRLLTGPSSLRKVSPRSRARSRGERRSGGGLSEAERTGGGTEGERERETADSDSLQRPRVDSRSHTL